MSDFNELLNLKFPKRLPQSLADAVENLPDFLKPMGVNAAFPAYAAHVSDFDYEATNQTTHELAFMHLTIGPQSCGKSNQNAIIDSIIADIKISDAEGRKKDKEWRDQCNSAGANQGRPVRDRNICIQLPRGDMTPASFAQRLEGVQNGGNKVMFNRFDELDFLNQVRGNNVTISAIIRGTWDRSPAGQERATAQGENIDTLIRWNWDASTTAVTARHFFRKSLLDGTLSRINTTLVVKPRDADRKIGYYSDDYHERQKVYIDRLKAAKGHFVNGEIMAFMLALERKLEAEGEEYPDAMQRESYAELIGRACAYGHMKAIMLYIMEGGVWSKEIENFVMWSVRSDILTKLYVFGDMMLKAKYDGMFLSQGFDLRASVRPLLDKLPDTFTKEQLVALRVANGQNTDVNYVTARWRKDGLIERVGKGVWKKTPKTVVGSNPAAAM